MNAGWYLVALLLFPAIHAAGVAIASLVDAGAAGAWLYPPRDAQQIGAMLLVPLAEEPAWRGFALPRLQQRYAPLEASPRLGVVWALWHAVMFLLSGAAATPALFALSMANIVAGSVVFGWLYNRTGGSVLAAVLAHAGAHLDNPTHALPSAPTPFVVYTAAIAALGALLVALDRAAFLRPDGGLPSPTPGLCSPRGP